MTLSKKTKDLTGQSFGKLIVLSPAGTDKHKKAQWRCRCSCGNEATVRSNDLQKKGATPTCGCSRKLLKRGAGRKEGESIGFVRPRLSANMPCPACGSPKWGLAHCLEDTGVELWECGNESCRHMSWANVKEVRDREREASDRRIKILMGDFNNRQFDQEKLSLGEEKELEIIADYKDGMKYRDIMKKHGIHSKRLNQLMDKYNVKLRRPKAAF